MSYCMFNKKNFEWVISRVLKVGIVKQAISCVGSFKNVHVSIIPTLDIRVQLCDSLTKIMRSKYIRKNEAAGR